MLYGSLKRSSRRGVPIVLARPYREHPALYRRSLVGWVHPGLLRPQQIQRRARFAHSARELFAVLRHQASHCLLAILQDILHFHQASAGTSGKWDDRRAGSCPRSDVPGPQSAPAPRTRTGRAQRASVRSSGYLIEKHIEVAFGRYLQAVRRLTHLAYALCEFLHMLRAIDARAG